MPFDGLTDALLADLAKLMLVRDGIAGAKTWLKYNLGGRSAGGHCLIGWVMVATDWNADEATRLAIDYLYPALPKQKQRGDVVESLYKFNDGSSREKLVRLVDDAMELARK